MTTDTDAAPKRAEWQALVSLSVARRGDREKAADFVLPGETIWLTEEESAGFLDRSRHRVPVIRPASEKNEPLPRITASSLYGAKGRPAPPAPVPGAAQPDDVKDETQILREPSGDQDAENARTPRRGRPPAA